MKRQHLLLGMILAVSLCSCSLKKPMGENVLVTLPEVDVIPTFSSEKKIERTEQVGKITVSISAEAPVIEKLPLYTVTLEPDGKAANDMARGLLLEEYPQLENELESEKLDIALYEGDQLMLLFKSEDIGYIYFTDYWKDLNNQSLEEGIPFTWPHYMTEKVPAGMDITGEEAAEYASERLEAYSCFRFEPWNVRAEYDYDKMKGVYHVYLQQQYEGMPIYGDGKTAFSPISAFVSEDGLFAFQGILALKELTRTPVHTMLPLDNAIEQFISNCPAYSESDRIICNKISLGYIPSLKDNTIVLDPAWIFECQRQDDADKSNISFTDYFNCGFYVENGKLWMD